MMTEFQSLHSESRSIRTKSKDLDKKRPPCWVVQSGSAWKDVAI